MSNLNDMGYLVEDFNGELNSSEYLELSASLESFIRKFKTKNSNKTLSVLDFLGLISETHHLIPKSRYKLSNRKVIVISVDRDVVLEKLTKDEIDSGVSEDSYTVTIHRLVEELRPIFDNLLEKVDDCMYEIIMEGR